MLVKPKCRGCKTTFKKGEHRAILEINTADGITKMLVCQACAKFWDKSADVLNNSRKTYDDDEREY